MGQTFKDVGRIMREFNHMTGIEAVKKVAMSLPVLTQVRSATICKQVNTLIKKSGGEPLAWRTIMRRVRDSHLFEYIHANDPRNLFRVNPYSKDDTSHYKDVYMVRSISEYGK